MPSHLLDLDPDLARRLGEADRARAREELRVGLVRLEVGAWQPPLDEPAPGHLGLLVVEGVILRRLSVGGSASVELLNHGDLLRPWQEDSASFVISGWECLETVRAAVLEPRVAAALGRYPALIEELVDRAMRRSRSMAVHAAVPGRRRIEDRILIVFWHLAERWGRREGDGVRVRLRLTHETIASLVAARRPSVTTALGDLDREGALVRRSADDWLLRGDPPPAGDDESEV